jgi:hypothetical protein
MPTANIPKGTPLSEFYPVEELIFGGAETDDSEEIMKFISRCELLQSIF